MKTLIAFAGGALLAGTIAFVAMRGTGGKEAVAEAPPAPVQAVAPAPVNPPAAIPAPAAPPVVAAAPIPEAPAPRKVKKEAAPLAAVRLPKPAPAAVPAQAAPAPEAAPAPGPAVVAPPVAPAAPVEPPAPAVTAEAPKPAFTPMKPKEPAKPAEPNSVTVSGGTTIPIRLAQTLDSSKLEDGQAFQATLDQPLVVDGFVIAERGAAIEGRVVSAVQAGRVKGLSHLSIELTRLTTSDGQRVPIRTAAWEKEGEKDTKGDATKVAVGAGIGAALGAIFGGGKGAATGAGAGGAAGAGTVLATRGKPVVLAAETRISFKLKDPVTIIERR
ncbi:MAG: hypothetical protein JST93_34000 [Acidobacteria bacterium]|nr:hypothetical protein [Acidobacteriota bacterium]